MAKAAAQLNRFSLLQLTFCGGEKCNSDLVMLLIFLSADNFVQLLGGVFAELGLI